MDGDGAEHAHLREAYQRRTQQLHDARGALAEAVSVLGAELTRLREERDQARAERNHLRQENAAMREHVESLVREVDKTRRWAGELERELRIQESRLAAALNLRIVRWTAPVRGILYRLRTLGRARR